MIGSSNYSIFYSNIKTSWDKQNNMTQYVKFFAFDEETAEIKNITTDVFLSAGKTYPLHTKHGDLENTMVLYNTDFITLQDELREIFKLAIKFRYV